MQKAVDQPSNLSKKTPEKRSSKTYYAHRKPYQHDTIESGHYITRIVISNVKDNNIEACPFTSDGEGSTTMTHEKLFLFYQAEVPYNTNKTTCRSHGTPLAATANLGYTAFKCLLSKALQQPIPPT